MPSRTWNRAAACVLTAALALAVPAVAAAGERQAARARRQAGQKPPVTWVGQVWTWLTAAWGNDGVLIDPDGFRGARMSDRIDGLQGEPTDPRPAPSEK